MSFNIARQVRGPAFIQYRGAQFFSKSPIAAPLAPETFKIAVEGYGDDFDERDSDLNLRMAFTPAGEWEQLTTLFAHRTRQIGAPLHDIVKMGSLNTATDVWTVTAHGRATGDRGRFARVGSSSAYPTLSAGSIDETTTYFVRAVDANSLKFYTTAADAAADTNALNFTGAHTDTIRFMFFDPLTIFPLDGSDPFRYENVIITQMPDVICAATETLLGEVQFQAFPIPGSDWSDANAIYTSSGISSVSASDLDIAAIKTLPYTAAWGASFPFSSMGSMNGWRFRFPQTNTALIEDTVGVCSYQLSSLAAQCTAQPKGITHGDLIAKLLGATPKRGQSRTASADDLNVSSGSDVYIRIYDALLRSGQVNYSAKQDLVGELVWQNKRGQSTSDPVFYVGTSAPA